jgi:hypothetical protein
VGNPEGKRPIRTARRSGWIMLKWTLERWGSMDWIDLAKDRDKWRALVNTIMNFRVP